MNLRTIFISSFLSLSSLGVLAQEQINLSGTWQFAFAANQKEADRLERFYTPDFAKSKFKSTPVPSNWALLGYEEPVYRGFKDNQAGEGFYVREFTIPQDWKDKRILLHFGGVWSSAEVWLNGNELGRHDCGYTSFAFDVTNKLKVDEPNKLAVRVRQITREYKFDVCDDWTWGGIYRDVTLEAMPAKRWIDDVVVQTTFDHLFQDANLDIRVMISDKHKNTLPGNYPSPGEPYKLCFTLTDKEGKEVAQRQMTVPAHVSTDREICLSLPVEAPHQWTAETPYLYSLKVELLEKEVVTHTRMERVGFRQISTDGGVFRINGQAVKLRGVNRHDEHPDVGRATTRKQWLEDLTLMKAANINYLRLSHYTPAEGFIELCDSMGMYVGNEVTLGGAGNLMYDPSFSGAVLQRSYETIVRDINKPSIIYWSIGNEDPLTSLHMVSVKLVKALDPTRPVLLPWRPEEWLPKEVDILAPHYWNPQEYDRLAGHSGRPVISTEYTHAYGNDAFGGLEARWKALTKHPAGAGAAVWMWADQGVKTPVRKKEKDLSEDEYLRINTAGWDGIVDSYRNFTRDYWETKAVYAPVYPVVDKISFVPGQDSVRIPIQNDFDFTNLSSVKMAWSVREDENVLYSGTDSMYGYPHTVSDFKLPVEKLVTVRPGKTYYVWFVLQMKKEQRLLVGLLNFVLRQNNRCLFLFVVNFWLLKRTRLPLMLVISAMCLVRRMDNWCLRS
nr:glycoside hydrolase family 2 TIM barrel-domain containing protein [Phocaeicola sartorii]